ncbi:helix-turn-helix transcriptional regulator [Clostridium cellulovorans]|uniref:Transcriptional regulator, AraC family n=1 Tax=Clostridium cellulovorans (strain ATCC 35296 / DSM 3052 / OCM 3 / 743B) TaxID=573061 RepID=D9SQB6_CLOC7|nr:helix-turn-helix transcriptional regulator [Clostridium cellulovorans]ADL50183.1 transcriptional regulator, AraC family [Clostridium cellulovorans 743B]
MATFDQQSIYIKDLPSSLAKMGFQFYQSKNIEDGLVTLPAFTGVRINFIFDGKSVASGVLKSGDLMIAGYTDSPLYGNVYNFSMASIGIHFSLFYYLTGLFPRQCRIPYKVPENSRIYSDLVPFFFLPRENWDSHALSIIKKNQLVLNKVVIKQMERVSLATQLYGYNQMKGFQDISNELGISYRQLQRDFHAFLGMTPSQYERLLRYQVAALNIKNTSIIEVALSSGYYDQAHMIREFKKFSDKTPRQIAELNDITVPFVDRKIDL